jgi:hypothetical protein
MAIASGKCLAFCFCFLFLGVLIGISIDAEFRPNHMRFWVNRVHELSFAPQEGDKIEWLKLDTGEHMVITFWPSKDSPCIDASTNPCTIGNIPDTSTYLYTCSAEHDASYICLDPQGGPKSVTKFSGIRYFFTRIFDLFEALFTRIGQLFGISQQSGRPGVTNGAPFSQNASRQATYQPILAHVYCDDATNKTAVIVPKGNQDDPIKASVGQQIQWGTAGANGFTISLSDPSTCSENVSPLPNGICTVAKAGNYTASVPSCTANTAESITVP